MCRESVLSTGCLALPKSADWITVRTQALWALWKLEFGNKDHIINNTLNPLLEPVQARQKVLLYSSTPSLVISSLLSCHGDTVQETDSAPWSNSQTLKRSNSQTPGIIEQASVASSSIFVLSSLCLFHVRHRLTKITDTGTRHCHYGLK